ncbi:MAG: hypothetical protein AAFV45_11180 [Pseudomonadota bacterium]
MTQTMTSRRLGLAGRALLALALLGSPVALNGALAEDFSKGSQAQELGLAGETKATFSGKVVDILCELSGDCPANCGDGFRNLGIVRASDQQLIMVSKNSQFEFNGGVDDLLPYCGKQVDVDGLLLGDDPGVKAKIYMAQFIRVTGDEDWIKTTAWTDAWKKRNPAVAEGEGPWFRRDPRVLKQIEQSGYFGLGHDVDDAWRKDNE